MRRHGRHRAGRRVALRRVVVVELVGERRHARRGPAVDLQRRAREVGVPDQRAEGRGRRRVRVERVLGRDLRSPRVRHAQHERDRRVGSSRRSPALGDRHERAAADGHAEAVDEEPLLVVVDPVEDRHAGEPPRGQRRPDRLGEDLAVDDAGDRGAREECSRGRRPARCAGTPRSDPGSPPSVAKASPKASAAARGSCVSAKAPLCTIARWKSPREPRETRWARTDRPPADWPAIVTLCGSPPNRAMLRLHPAQGGLLIHQPVVAGRAAGRRRQRGMRQEAEGAEPVVDRDDYDAVRRELGAVVVAGGVLREAAAVDPHEHGAGRLLAQRRRGDVEVQAVLVDRARREERSSPAAGSSARTRSRRGRRSSRPEAAGAATAGARWGGRRRAARGTRSRRTRRRHERRRRR